MCLVTKTIETKTSTNSIIVYKIVQNNLESIFNKGYTYKVGEIMNDDVEPNISSGFEHYFIKEGFFHSYKDLEEAKSTKARYDYYTKYYKRKDTFTIYKCEIPSNTPYIEGVYNKEICSKSLKLIERV